MAPRPTRTVEHRAAAHGQPALRIERSTRRRKSASAYPRDGVVVVQLPARLPAAEEERLIADLVAKVTRRARTGRDDDALRHRAEQLADAYLDGVRPTSITWSSRMRRRYGSCTPADGSVRISDQLQGMPDYVLDYVLVHELAHLTVPDHSRAFHELVGRYPETERARAYLEGFAAGQGRAALDDAFADDVKAAGTDLDR